MLWRRRGLGFAASGADGAGDAAPQVVPVDGGLGVDVGLVIFLDVVLGDEHGLAVELAVFGRLGGGIELLHQGVVADGETHAALPEGIGGDGAGEFAAAHRVDGGFDAV